MTWLVALGLLTLYAVGLWLAYRMGSAHGEAHGIGAGYLSGWLACMEVARRNGASVDLDVSLMRELATWVPERRH
jgi:hypothetical protein